MSTEKEGRVLDKTLLKYYRGRQVEDVDRAALEKLCRASYIEFYTESNSLFARVSETGRSLKPKLGPYLRLIVGRFDHRDIGEGDVLPVYHFRYSHCHIRPVCNGEELAHEPCCDGHEMKVARCSVTTGKMFRMQA